MYFQTKKELTWWGNINMESNSSIWLIYFMNLDLRDQNFDLNGCPQKSFLTKTIRNGKNIEEESQLPKGSPSFTETGVLEIQSTSQEIWQNINSQKSKIDTFKVWLPTTVKLGFKERLNKEQLGNIEPFLVTNMPIHFKNSEQIGFSEQLCNDQKVPYYQIRL